MVATGVETEYAMDSNPVPTRRLKEVTKSFEVQESSFSLSSESMDTAVNKNSFDDQEFNNLETDSMDTKAEDSADLNDINKPSEVPEKNIEEEIVSEIQPQNVVKKPFGFFGLKKQKITNREVDLSPKNKPVQQKTFGQQESILESGDLFGDNTDEELEIPSFLRRQTN